MAIITYFLRQQKVGDMLKKINEIVENVEGFDFHVWDDEYGSPINEAHETSVAVIDDGKVDETNNNLKENEVAYIAIDAGPRKASVVIWKINNRMRVALVYLHADGINETVKTSVVFSRFKEVSGFARVAKWLEKEAKAAGNSSVKVLSIGNFSFVGHESDEFLHVVQHPLSAEDDKFIRDVKMNSRDDREAAKADYGKDGWVYYYTDGSAPGSFAYHNSPWGTAGWVLGDINCITFSVTAYGGLDNNQLEMLAILDALRYHDKNRPNDKKIRILSDSTSAIQRFKDFRAERVSKYMESLPNVDVIEMLKIIGRYSIDIQWVRGHDSNKWHNVIDIVVGSARKIADNKNPRGGQKIKSFSVYELKYLKSHMGWAMYTQGLTKSKFIDDDE